MPGNTSGLLRARAVLDRWFELLVVVCVLVALAGGWLAYQGHVDPGTETEQRTVSTWTVNGSTAHSATVTAENPVYDVDRTLRNRPVYLRQPAPVLEGTTTFVYRASDGGSLNVTLARRTVLLSVEDNRDRTTEVWRRNYGENTTSVHGVDPGTPVESRFSVNVSRMMNVSDRVDEELDNPPGQVELLIVTTVDLTGTVNGRPVNRTESAVVAVEFDGSAYRVTTNGTAERFETTRSVEVPRDPGPVKRLGGPLLLVVGLLGGGGLVAARERDRLALTETERELLDYEDDRTDFEEWIVTIRLPDEALDRPRGEAKSLASLVDFAIDTDSSVVEDPARNTYYVVHDGYLYSYRPPTREEIEPLPPEDTPDGRDSGGEESESGDDADEPQDESKREEG